MKSAYFAALLSLVACLPYAAAQLSLYIPGFDPQPVTADEIGVGADGATTWLIAPGVSSGTIPVDYGFDGPATLVLGPTHASVLYVDPTGNFSVQEDCSISDGVAVCNENAVYASQVTIAAAVTEQVSPFPVQGAANAAAASAPSSPSSPIVTGTASGVIPVKSGSVGSSSGGVSALSGMTTKPSSSTPTGTGSTTPSASRTVNGDVSLKSFPLVALAAAGFAAAFLA